MHSLIILYHLIRVPVEILCHINFYFILNNQSFLVIILVNFWSLAFSKPIYTYQHIVTLSLSTALCLSIWRPLIIPAFDNPFLRHLFPSSIIALIISNSFSHENWNPYIHWPCSNFFSIYIYVYIWGVLIAVSNC